MSDSFVFNFPFAAFDTNSAITEGTTAAWRLQIVVWQNMSFQSNHPE